MPTKNLDVNIEYSGGQTLKRVAVEALTVGLVASGTYMVDSGLDEIALEYPEYALVILSVSAVIRGILNWWKYRKGRTLKVDSKTKTVIGSLKR